MSTRNAWGIGAVCALALGLSPVPAVAQGAVEFTPFFTSYYPIATVDDAVGGDQTISEKQVAAPGFGARLTFWVGRSIGFEGAGSIAWSGTKFTSTNPTSTPVSVSLSGYLISASGRLLYRPARTNFYLLIGGGIVSHGGDTWNFSGITGKTDPAAVVGFGARASVTPKIALTVNVESYLYAFDPDGTGTEYESKLQPDIYVSIGVPVSFGRR